jgi:hypothetical protein
MSLKCVYIVSIKGRHYFRLKITNFDQQWQSWMFITIGEHTHIILSVVSSIIFVFRLFMNCVNNEYKSSEHICSGGNHLLYILSIFNMFMVFKMISLSLVCVIIKTLWNKLTEKRKINIKKRKEIPSKLDFDFFFLYLFRLLLIVDEKTWLE